MTKAQFCSECTCALFAGVRKGVVFCYFSLHFKAHAEKMHLFSYHEKLFLTFLQKTCNKS